MKTYQAKTTKTPTKTLTTVYVGNLNYEISNRDLKKLFSEFGVVKSAKIVLDPETEKSKGIAFIQMFQHADAMKAIKELDGAVYENRTLKVSIANDRFAKVQDTKVLSKKPEVAFKKEMPKKSKAKKGLETLFQYLKSNRK
jgi:RNA recognition motif-containing protein